MSAKPSLPKKKPAKNDLRGVIAWNVRTLRVSKGWSQEQLALTCELDRTYVSAIERCIWNISISNIERLALSLEVEPWMLLKPA
jgi:transcriptional regulator with XRE-family HTH domain